MLLKETLDEVHKVQLNILLEIKRICEEYRIPYTLMGGTALGAVRHKGFVPWDEDADIAMARIDYERFLEIAKSKLNKDFFLQTRDIEPEWPFLFARIRANNTTFIEKPLLYQNINHGIFVDIVPFDNCPDNLLMRKLHKRALGLTQGIRWFGTIKPQENEKSFRYIIKLALYKIINPFSYRLMDRIERKLNTAFNNTSTKYMGVIIGDYKKYERAVMPKEWIMPPAKAMFEGIEMKIPNRYHEFLTHYFGDYMTPSLEKAGSKQVILVDVKNSYKIHINNIRNVQS